MEKRLYRNDLVRLGIEYGVVTRGKTMNVICQALIGEGLNLQCKSPKVIILLDDSITGMNTKKSNRSLVCSKGKISFRSSPTKRKR